MNISWEIQIRFVMQGTIEEEMEIKTNESYNLKLKTKNNSIYLTFFHFIKVL